MFKKSVTITAGIIFLLSTVGLAFAGQGKGPESPSGQQVSSQTRSQFQKQIQVDKNCDGPQIKTQTRKRTNYLK